MEEKRKNGRQGEEDPFVDVDRSIDSRRKVLLACLLACDRSGQNDG